MVDDIRRRTACDRCHSQKLKCPKRPGADICERCFKAKTSCSYSPFRQKKVEDQHARDQSRKQISRPDVQDVVVQHSLPEVVSQISGAMSDEGAFCSWSNI
jgi:hypothetical protein